MFIRRIDDRFIGFAEAGVAFMARRGISLPVVMRETITAVGATFMVQVVCLMIEGSWFGLSLGLLATIVAKPTYLEWRFHDNASRMEWTPKLSASYRALAFMRRERWRDFRLVFVFLFIYCIILNVRDLILGHTIPGSDIAGTSFILLSLWRMYIECVEPIDPDVRVQEPHAVPQGA